jgi:hypothetical protein
MHQTIPPACAGCNTRAANGPVDQSSFRIVPIPRILVTSALLLLSNKSTKNVSSASFLLSPLTTMVLVLVVSPGVEGQRAGPGDVVVVSWGGTGR